ncbi:MAG: DUF3795 domain-containing protein [Methanosarcinales archaeon]|nr:DUF3795 domain-containing protein [Methanosarcinales archaeon]
MSKIDIGCCGAYCKTCREFRNNNCRGCRLGYEDGGRDINRAKCKMKLCCFRDKGYETCADCPEWESCDIVQEWYKKGYSRGKCRESIEFIRKEGYGKFIKIADKWKNHYGKLD